MKRQDKTYYHLKGSIESVCGEKGANTDYLNREGERQTKHYKKRWAELSSISALTALARTTTWCKHCHIPGK
jgi:hypothetical protein